MQTPQDILKQYWKYDAFRPLQADIIQSVLDGNDTLALLPTGGGKSICFQVPAMMKDGICIVISPLIALMKDQVHQLKQREIKAAAIYSGLSYQEIDIILNNAVFSYYKFLYVSPERLKTDIFLERFKDMPVNLIAVDEAHCISQWGYDFRPPYLEIANIREYHNSVPVLALTASATPIVQKDIQEKLHFNHNQVFKKSFLRENISFVVRHETAKLPKLLEIIEQLKGSGIIYVRNRKQTQVIADYLKKNKISADFYHAGLDTPTRDLKQNNWIANKTKVIVCTNAFGMGIDKPDVRFVIHIDIPENLEAYYQEAGRAGRDGKKSYAILLYTDDDKENLTKNIAQKFPPIEEVKQIYNAVFNHYNIALGNGKFNTKEFDIYYFSKLFNKQVAVVYNSLKILEQANYMQLNESVMIPARLKFTVDKMSLYNYQIKNPKYNEIIKALLRAYGGILEFYTNIKEKDLAVFLKTDESSIVQQLNYLNKQNIIHYLPQTDKPQITFLEERLPEQSLLFDTAYLQKRKDIATEQLNAIINYTENTAICRQKIICTYFGDEINDCGQCDVCLEKKYNAQKTEKLKEIKKNILSISTDVWININDIIPKKHFEKHDYELVIRELLDEQILIMNEKNEIKRK
ncbi:MAG: RecQ family ATP-dependent DNA helicase [Chitinophagales bacterium]|nr:RecQ family ATP-dependent DNA helicase [Chitinophagales bacterium]